LKSGGAIRRTFSNVNFHKPPSNTFSYCQFNEVIVMTTGKKAASEAGKELKSKASTKPEKMVAASDLSQANRSPKGKGPKQKPK
jgi:hypothetical protein